MNPGSHKMNLEKEIVKRCIRFDKPLQNSRQKLSLHTKINKLIIRHLYCIGFIALNHNARGETTRLLPTVAAGPPAPQEHHGLNFLQFGYLELSESQSMA